MYFVLERRLIFSILLMISIISIQAAYAEPEFSFEFGSTGDDDDELDNPTDVVVDKNGKTIYVVDSENDRINVFEDDGDDDFRYGTFCDIAVIQLCDSNADGASGAGDGQFNDPISIAIDALGKFFVADSDNKRIQVFEDDGEFQLKFGSSSSADDEYLGLAKGIAIQESSKNIFVSDVVEDSVSVFDSTGDFLFKFDSFDGTDFKNPTNMVIDNDEEMLYVADSGEDRIVIFELVDGSTCPSGTEESVDGVCFVKQFGTDGDDNGEFDDPTGLVFDSANDLLYVADTNNDRIQIFKIVSGNTCPSGTEEIVNGVCFVEEFGSSGTGDGEFDSPMGIDLDETNNLLFVADSDNDRIQVFELVVVSSTLTPLAPEDLDATPASITSILITWKEPVLSENVPAISGYKIEYRIDSDDYITITENTASTATSFLHQGLDVKDTYTYRVYSINSAGTSVSSSTASAKPAHTNTPTTLTATAISPSQIKLSWLPPSDTFGLPISGYQIKEEIASDTYEEIGTTGSSTTTFTVNSLTKNETYTFVVVAKLGVGLTDISNSASATPREDSTDTTGETTIPSAVKGTISTQPIKLVASVGTATQVNLAWSPPGDDGNTPITGYKIEFKKDDGSYETLVADTKSTTGSYSHTNLTTKSKYTYQVSAINSAGISEPSNEVSETPRITGIKISPLGKLTIGEGKLLLFSVKLVDSTIKEPIFSLEKNPPQGAKIISNTGMFSWTPSDSDGGKSYTFDIVAKKDGMSDRQPITITVNDSIKDSQSASEPEPKETEPQQTTSDPKELGVASFVDELKDPQSYVDRYNSEAIYKEWFDDNYSEYESIYQAVGLEELKEEAPKTEVPKVKEKKFGICGPGTKLIDGVCTIVEKPIVKPWWQFW